jgi:squalene-hopene/tetraprenyl-beta-curcumene cyclase
MQSNVYVLRPQSGVTPTIVADAANTAHDAAQNLMALQQADGHLVFELEADATIPSEYIFLNHFLDMREPELEAEMGEYLRSLQSKTHGGWPLFTKAGSTSLLR